MERTGDWPVLNALKVPPSPSTALPPVEEFLHYLVDSRLLDDAGVETFFAENPGMRGTDTGQLIEALKRRGLVNSYHLERLLAGQTFGLVLGNYRIMEPLGAGGMGVVYKAEHIHMKRVVALKVLASEEEENDVFLQRFSSEMQALAVLRHPNIVLAFDAGEVPVPQSRTRRLRYLVMEFVRGQNLEQHIAEHGALPIPVACEYIRQAADGLRHAYEHGLVHRDIKPSNLLLTPEGQIKILDFGLARLCRRRCTEAHAVLGTVDYMAPEQCRDARAVDIRADIYALGGTLYWLLTATKPFPSDRPPLEELLARQRESPMPLRGRRPEIPLELEAVVCQMMARDPNDRYPTPLAVLSALSAFLEPNATLTGQTPVVAAAPVRRSNSIHTSARSGASGEKAQRVLIVSPELDYRAAFRALVEEAKFTCCEARNGSEAREWLAKAPVDVIVVDVEASATGIPGAPAAPALLCRLLRREPAAPQAKILLLTPTSPWAMRAPDNSEADDRVARAAPAREKLARLRGLLRLKAAEDQAAAYQQQHQALAQQMEQLQRLRDADSSQSQDVLIFAMAKMAEARGLETAAHLLRMQSYVRVLAEEAARLPDFTGQIDPFFVRLLERCVPLHDIGKVAIPDHILLKPGRLDPEERSIMESHTVVGANILEAVVHQHGANLSFLKSALDIARYHHERFDGQGYPEGLRGTAIPLAARIVTVADVYDALRCKLVYKPGLSHTAARRLLLDPNQGQFDPALILAFQQCEANFDRIFEETQD